MIITCEECNTSYNLSASQLKPSGTKVRCTNCQHVFTAYPPEDAPAIVKAEPVADTQSDAPPVTAPDDDLGLLDSDDLFEIDDQNADAPAGEDFDLSEEDFDLPGNDRNHMVSDEPSSGDLELTEEDLDLVMDMAPPESPVPAAPEAATAMAAEAAPAAPDLGELDDLLDDIPDEAAPAHQAGADLGDALDLDLDFDEDTEAADTEAPPPPALEGTDELDLDLDLDLDLGDDEAVPEATDTKEEASLSLDDDLQLDDVFSEDTGSRDDQLDDGLSLDDDLDIELAPESMGEAETDGIADLEIEDIDLELDLTDEADEAVTEAADTQDGGDAELSLAFEEEAAPAANDTAADDGLDDLDLDLDFDLETEAPESPALADGSDAGDPLLELDLGADADDAVDLDDDDELSLDLDNLELMGDGEPEAADRQEEELELDLGGGLELEMDEPPASGSDTAGGDDLDLADLEGLLDETEAGQDTDADALDLEEGSLFGDDDLGLGSELDSILDEDDDTSQDTFSLEEEPELDLDLESQPALSGDDDSLDLSDFEYLAEDGETAPSEAHFDSGDMELEFQVDDESSSALEEADAGFAPPPAEPHEKKAEPEIVPEASAAAMAPAGAAPVPKKRGTSKLLIAVLIIVLLLGGGYCAYILLDGMGIRIPYVSDYLKPEANDPGNLQMTTFDINSRFVDSQVLGRIFVITGKVKNGYDHPRGFVQLTGKLFTKGKVLASSQAVYAGNLISDMDLVNLNADELTKRLNNRFGNNRMNSRVQPGKALPFMVVFSTLPEAQLEEFTIEVDASTALK